MQKIIKTLLATVLIATIVATPKYKVSSPTLNMGTTMMSDQNSSSTTITR